MEHDWLRRLRGALGMGLTWGFAWFLAGMVMLLTLLVLTGSTGADVPYPLGFGMFGFIAGVGFSGILGLFDGRRRLEQLSIPRFALWGGLGGLLLSTGFVSLISLIDDPSFFSNLVVLGPVFSTAGALSAAGSLAIARRGADPDLLGAGTDDEPMDRSLPGTSGR